MSAEPLPCFEMWLRDVRKSVTFRKTCEAMKTHSDTALFKVKPRGIYIMLTDFESFCCVECRLTSGPKNRLTTRYQKGDSRFFTAKIQLDHLVEILANIHKRKNIPVLHAQHVTDRALYIGEYSPSQSDRMKNPKPITNHLVESVEHRARIYWILSSRKFCDTSAVFAKVRIPPASLNKIVTMMAILSGQRGGVANLRFTPLSSDGDQLTIEFYLKNQAGNFGTWKIHTFKHAETVPVLHMPQREFSLKVWITYLKRSQNLFPSNLESITLYASEHGIMLQSDPKDQHSVVVYTADMSGEDVDSFF